MTVVLQSGDEYIHIDDHRHNDTTWHAINDWFWSVCFGTSKHKKVYHSQITIINLRHMRDDTMATKANNAKKKGAEEKVDFIGFVNITLTDDEYAEIDKALEGDEVPNMPNHIDYLMELGKVTFSYLRGSVQCTLTVLEGKQAGYAVSAFSESLIESILLVRLKVQNYLDTFEDIYKKGGSARKRG